MATFADAQAGWEIYKSGDFALTREEINVELMALGHAQIAPRTYAHYNKLIRYGFENYIPINQLDVKTLEDPVWDLALRNRYFTWEAAIPVRLHLVSEDAPIEVEGAANRISEAIVAVRIPATAGGSASDFRKGFPVLVHFIGRGERRFAYVDAVSEQLKTGVITLRLNFATYRPIEKLLKRRPLQLRNVRITLTSVEEDVFLTRLVQQIYWLFQALESSRTVCEELLSTVENQPYSITAPQVRRLRLESPVELVIGVTFAVGLLLEATIGRYLKYRKEFWEGSKAKQETKALEWENERRKLIRDFPIQELIAATADQLAAALLEEGFAASIDLNRLDTQRTNSTIRKQLLKSVEELAENVSNIDITEED